MLTKCTSTHIHIHTISTFTHATQLYMPRSVTLRVHAYITHMADRQTDRQTCIHTAHTKYGVYTHANYTYHTSL